MYTLVAGGYRSSIALLQFEPSTAKLKLVSESETPENPSWVEKSKVKSGVLYSLSENDDGLALSLALRDDKIIVTGQRKTYGGATHVHCMKDGSGIVIANFIGGSVIFFPLNPDGSLSQTSESPKLQFPNLYEDKSPNPERQDSPHAHQVLEGENGVMYIPDLGNDRVWIIGRVGESGLEIRGELKCPPGSGPRHGVISDDLKHLYILSELTHIIYCFILPPPPSSNPTTFPIISPVQEFSINILPPTISPNQSDPMLSAEIVAHPQYPNVLYASNRAEMDINDHPSGSIQGDAVTVILLSEDGEKCQSITHVRTGCNNIRALSISPDGRYASLAGQNGGGIEIWAISGERGENWKLAAKLENLKKITDIVWI
ncbi:hypothetical protein TREMEDRAFT_30617 [Tremella mesenterica DSM 1558]|uniref:uncharacterized protein n=1 Tax=Tremella mesenterica (strain ATCC 24925 / CBS 8224 / DSM 1558 / NBRC 9311 / NRRL Y-6157 / RJB 2259-6 / UBC 559-6) TaxID=578456 RepID=UPI0003F48C89|nr:uncharacterized protein TREMEDRAFT_30617 [Tremella mesenterica DSM 1558]EIW69401.1 hypothetical protein TREMEDRAFT_30617 [Tremella mesenterica DSM 1558]